MCGRAALAGEMLAGVGPTTEARKFLLDACLDPRTCHPHRTPQRKEMGDGWTSYPHELLVCLSERPAGQGLKASGRLAWAFWA